MGRYTGANCKICRRNGTKLYLKGNRCHTAKCAIEKRNFPPGHHGHSFGRKMSEYGRRLREKQKLRFFYGVSEKSIRSYFAEASRQKGITGHNMLYLFERRLDNVIFRTGLAESRKQARQLVRHGHFRLIRSEKDRKVNIPSLLVEIGDQLTIKVASQAKFKAIVEAQKDFKLPTWINFNAKTLTISVSESPTREYIDVPVEEQLIVEFYSR